MEKFWVSFRTAQGTLLCRKMNEADAIKVANENQWISKTLSPEVSRALDELTGNEDHWVVSGIVLHGIIFPSI